MNIKNIMNQMSLNEKASLCSGEDFWHVRGFEKYGIPKMMLTDGPHGLRKQGGEADHLGINESIKAVCFPTGATLASSFNREAIRRVGETIGNECQAESIGVILGPGVNIKRSPLCGRNFEYFSEDPYVASEMAAHYINGVQSQGVGTSVKHFLANNQEKERLTSSSQVSERALRELYLAAFEGAVKQAKPWTIMSSYNKINGVYASENKKYLTDVLRDEWGFDGFVVSDWGAVNDIVKDLAAGLDLEMPSSNGIGTKLIVDAVKDGRLSEATLNQAVERILTIVKRYAESRNENAVFDREKDHEIAREIAAESMVLLKNEGALPLVKESKVLLVGEFAKSPRYQGGGSSHINPFKVESALEIVQDRVQFCLGYETKNEQIQAELEKEAIEAAKVADTVVVFAGLPESYETEGYDRTHMNLPQNQNHLISQLAEVNKNIVVVLHNGSPVEMPWVNEVNAILETYLGGEAVGGATVQVLYGEVNPSGHLAESFPVQLQDNPSYLNFGGERGIVNYSEDVFVGYRYYDSKEQAVMFPFGHGLSYTTFTFSNLTIDKNEMKATDTVSITVDITNTGDCFGKEVVQLYVAPKKGEVSRPVHELKRFEKVALNPGETKTVNFVLKERDFAYYEELISDWYVESNQYVIEVGASSRNLPMKAAVTIENDRMLPIEITMDTPMFEVMKNPIAAQIINKAKEEAKNTILSADMPTNILSKEAMEAMMREVPLRQMVMMMGIMTTEQAQELIIAANSGKVR